jgi:hypothetical protein
MRPIRGLLIVYALFLVTPSMIPAAPVLEWIRQFGTPDIDYNQSSESTAGGQGSFYVAGSTYGDIAGMNAGSLDGYIAKYNSEGNRLWGRQVGTSSIERIGSSERQFCLQFANSAISLTHFRRRVTHCSGRRA